MAQHRRQEPREEGWVAKVPPLPELPRSEAVLLAKPRLGDEVEALFAEAAALVASRPRRNTRLQILEEEMHRHGAAKKIGTAWRQQAQHRQQKAAQLLQNHFRGWRARRVVQREREKQRASRLQRWWRKKRFYLAWLHMHQQRKAAVKLQAFHRGNKARQEVYNMLVVHSWAVLRMQAVFRGQRARRKAQKQQKCARKIQAHWRWHRLWQAYLQERKRRRAAAVMTVQAFIRGFAAKQDLLKKAAEKEYVEEQQRRRAAAVMTVQALIRSFAAKQDLLKKAAEKEIEVAKPNEEVTKGSMPHRQEASHSLETLRSSGSATPPQVRSLGEGKAEEAKEEKHRLAPEHDGIAHSVGAEMVAPEGFGVPDEGKDEKHGRAEMDKPKEEVTTGKPHSQAPQSLEAVRGSGSATPPEVRSLGVGKAQETKEDQVGPIPADTDALEEEEERSTDDAPAPSYDFSSAQLTAFALQPRPADVILSAEMLLVKRTSNTFSQDMVYGNGVAPSSPSGSYFEVRLESAVARGFALGFQAANAVGSKVTEAPSTACSLGFDGMACIGGSSSLVSDWPTRPWCSADRLGLLASAGYLALAVNGQWLVEVPGAVPEGPLVPFVNLGTGPMAVSLEVGVEVPKGGALSGFNRRLCSPLVTLEGRTKATRTGVHPKGAGLGCVLFGNGPLPSFPEGRYFEVCIEEVTKVFADGLNLGVAVGLPRALPEEPYATCEEVPRSFCYGFDGMAHRYDMDDMIEIDWSPENLEIGDAVGILVTSQGVMQLIVNGVLEVDVIDGLPEQELFPLVELMGNTVAVSLRAGAAPPAIRQKVRQAPEEQEPPEVAEQVPPLPPPAAAPVPTETVPHAAAAELAKPEPRLASVVETRRPSARPSAALPAPRRSTEVPRLPAKAPTEPAFSAQLLSKNMQLSKDGNSVRHKDEAGRELFGIAVGVSPLIPFPAGRYFEVRVDRVRENMPDGLAVGFTLVPPTELAGEDPHEVSDTLPESWTAGYDGFYRSVNFEENEQVRVGWSPSSLQVNDRVGALLSRAGQFIVVVNGKVVVRVADDFPLADVEAFYPVVDLLGRVCQVTMVRDAVPPPAAVDGTIFTGFDPKFLGKAVSLSNSRLSCSSRDPVGKELGGVVFGDGPLPCTGPDGEAYFEVLVEELRQGNDDGLVLGVASKRPEAMDDILMGCDVKEAWSLGYNGCSFSPDEEEDVPVKWSPVNLKRGDHVGLLVQGDGSLIVLLNSSPVCKGPKKVPVLDVPLYPFVDLLGNTKAVQLVKPTQELVKTAVVNCAKAVKRSLVSGKDPAFFDAW